MSAYFNVLAIFEPAHCAVVGLLLTNRADQRKISRFVFKAKCCVDENVSRDEFKSS